MTNDILYSRTFIALLNHFGSEKFVETWWTSSNEFFDFSTPEEIWESDPMAVMNYVFQNKRNSHDY